MYTVKETFCIYHSLSVFDCKTPSLEEGMEGHLQVQGFKMQAWEMQLRTEVKHPQDRRPFLSPALLHPELHRSSMSMTISVIVVTMAHTCKS
jgi:hypothetical protein